MFGILEILFSVLVPVTSVLIPAIIINLVEKGTEMTLLIEKLLAVFLIVGVVYGIHAFLKGRNNMQYIQFVYGKFMKDYVGECFQVPYDTLEKEDTRVLQQKALNCLAENYTGLEGFLRHNVSLITGVLGLCLYIAFISNISIYIVLLLVAISFLQKFVYDKAKNYEASMRTSKSKLNVVQEYIRREAYDVSAGKDIRLYHLFDWLNDIFLQKNESFKRILRKERGYYYLYDVAGLVLQLVRDAVCYGYLFFQLSKGMEVSLFVFYLGIISGYAAWFSQISDSIAQIGRDHLMLCDFRKFMDLSSDSGQPKKTETDEKSFLQGKMEIVFDHVTYSYEHSDKKILDDISFRLENGRKYALVGVNGAGKTTIVKLICGFYKPDKGHIYINGIDTRELQLPKYWEKLAVVFQEAFMHSFSIAENISGLPYDETDIEKCQMVVEKAGLKEKIAPLEKGLNTYLNKDIREDGIQFSGGESQKLMLARALYKEADFYVLDEPTAALDALAENEIYEKYQMLINQKTALFISHRLASTRFCDSIFFLENGKMAETGTHEELMKENGLYAKMFHVQSKYYQEVEC